MIDDQPDLRNEASILTTSSNCWRIEEASRIAVIVDADAYFRAVRSAMTKAERRIMLVGWDFDPRIDLDRSGTSHEGPDEVAALFKWLVDRREDLEIFILRWDVGAVKMAFSAHMLLTLAHWIWNPRISVELDGHHPIAASHHQKIVVIDDRVAFCGGIDMTGDRWDTPEHRDHHPLRITPAGDSYGPWHDAATALEGPVARALGDLCRHRWKVAGRDPLEPVDGGADCWPDGLVPLATNVPVAISRTIPKMDDEPEIREIEQLYVDLIASARKTIYAESQYFASRRIAIAMAARLDEDDGPEIVVVNPLTAEGWLEPLAMDTARGRLLEALHRRDRHGRFRMYHPVTEAGEPIYVHAKIFMADDRLIRIGSSNMNNRSLGLDTECDVTIDASLSGDGNLSASIAGLRTDLLAEHLGVAPSLFESRLADTGSLISAIESAIRPSGRSLRPYLEKDLSAIEKFLADNEILDPECPDEMFEALSNRGLFRGWKA